MSFGVSGHPTGGRSGVSTQAPGAAAGAAQAAEGGGWGPFPVSRLGHGERLAIASTSTSAPFGRAPTANVERAGGGSVMCRP